MTNKIAEYIEKEAFIVHIRNKAKGLHERMPIDLIVEAVINEVKAFPAVTHWRPLPEPPKEETE